MAEPARPEPERATANGESDWATDATDRVVELVDVVREKTTGQALKAARAAVYGVVIVFIAVPVAVMLVIAILRGVDLALNALFEVDIWATYLLVGAIFVGVGALLWSKRREPRSEDSAPA